MPIIIFDLEGVLIDNSERLNYALSIIGARSIDAIPLRQRSRFWRIFLDLELAKRMDRVNDFGLQILSERSGNNRIAIVSGTTREIGSYQLDLIRRRASELSLNIRIDFVFLRPKGSKERAVVFKERILRWLLLEDDVAEIHDDEEEIVEMAKKYGVKGVLWRNLRPVSPL